MLASLDACQWCDDEGLFDMAQLRGSKERLPGQLRSDPAGGREQISRRDTVTWLLASAGAACAGMACALCRIAPAQAGSLALCSSQGPIDFNTIKPVASTGQPNLDRSLAAELNNQSGFFGSRPAFRLYDGPDWNAAATPDKDSQAPQTDGTILYHKRMLQANLGLVHWGGAIVAGVIAHEFAHIFQFRSGKFVRWQAAGRR